MKYHDAYKRTASPIAWEVEKFSRHEPAKDDIIQLTHDYLTKTLTIDLRMTLKFQKPVRPVYGSDRSDSHVALLSRWNRNNSFIRASQDKRGAN